VPANSLPQIFLLTDVTSIMIEANKPADTVPDKNTDSLYIQAQDTNGGISNEAYINIKHSGIASLESNFIQGGIMEYSRLGFDNGGIYFNPLNYVVGPKPNINDTFNGVTQSRSAEGANDRLNLIQTKGSYPDVKVAIAPFNLYLKTQSNGNGKARATVKLVVYNGATYMQLAEWGSGDNQEQSFIYPGTVLSLGALPTGRKVRVFLAYDFDNRRGSNSGSMNVFTNVTNFKVDISTTKTV